MSKFLSIFRSAEGTIQQTPQIASSSRTSNSTEIMSERNIALVPVHREDFKKINEFAEAAWICRDLQNAEKIKEMRRNLLREVGLTCE